MKHTPSSIFFGVTIAIISLATLIDGDLLWDLLRLLWKLKRLLFRLLRKDPTERPAETDVPLFPPSYNEEIIAVVGNPVLPPSTIVSVDADASASGVGSECDISEDGLESVPFCNAILLYRGDHANTPLAGKRCDSVIARITPLLQCDLYLGGLAVREDGLMRAPLSNSLRSIFRAGVGQPTWKR